MDKCQYSTSNISCNKPPLLELSVIVDKMQSNKSLITFSSLVVQKNQMIHHRLCTSL